MLEILHWMMLHGWVDQLKLTAIKLEHSLISILYHAGDSQHTQNIQINKITSENEKCVFDFTEKNHTEFLANPKLAFHKSYPCVC